MGKILTYHSKQMVYDICDKLEDLNLISNIEYDKYSVKFLVRIEKDDTGYAYTIRDRIKSNFEDKGFKVNIIGSHWLEIIIEDIIKIIDECFENK